MNNSINIFEFFEKLLLLKKISKVEILTIDNPGWGITIKLNSFDGQAFSKIKIERSDDDWLFCNIKGENFEGDGGLFNLEEVFSAFVNFITKSQNKVLLGKDFEWLINWYANLCDGYWEHCYGINIENVNETSNWLVRICLGETELENKIFAKIAANKTEHDWLECYIENNIFHGYGGPLKLGEILTTFREWAEKQEAEQTQV